MNYQSIISHPISKSQLASLLTGAISNFENFKSIKIESNHFVQVYQGECNWHIPYVNREGDSRNCINAIAEVIEKYKQAHPQILFET